MLEHKVTDRERWSYYDEFLKSNRIRKVRQEHAGFDKLIVSQIQSNQFSKASELRDKLPTICAGPAKILRRFLDQKIGFADAYDNAVDAGGENYALKKLRKFREWAALSDTEEDLLDSNKQVRDKMLFELKEIEKKARQLKVLLEANKAKIT